MAAVVRAGGFAGFGAGLGLVEAGFAGAPVLGAFGLFAAAGPPDGLAAGLGAEGPDGFAGAPTGLAGVGVAGLAGAPTGLLGGAPTGLLAGFGADAPTGLEAGAPTLEVFGAEVPTGGAGFFAGAPTGDVGFLADDPTGEAVFGLGAATAGFGFGGAVAAGGFGFGELAAAGLTEDGEVLALLENMLFPEAVVDLAGAVWGFTGLAAAFGVALAGRAVAALAFFENMLPVGLALATGLLTGFAAMGFGPGFCDRPCLTAAFLVGDFLVAIFPDAGGLFAAFAAAIACCLRTCCAQVCPFAGPFFGPTFCLQVRDCLALDRIALGEVGDFCV